MNAKLIVFAALGATLVPLGRAQNLVQNPGFENTTFSPWIATGFGSVATDDPHGGLREASFAPGTTVLTQNLATLANTNYTVSFYLRNADNVAGTYSVLLGTTTLVNTSLAPGAYTLYTYTATTSPVAGSVLTFNFSGASTFHLDDVTVQAVPEPSALAALGLGALGLLRRRRKA